jgi:hypothetical protein
MTTTAPGRNRDDSRAVDVSLRFVVGALIAAHVLLPLDRGFPTIPVFGYSLSSAIAATLVVLIVLIVQSRGAILAYLFEPYCLVQSAYGAMLVLSSLRAASPPSALHGSFRYYSTFVLNYVILRYVTRRYGVSWLPRVVVVAGVGAAGLGIAQGALGVSVPLYDAWYEDYFSIPAVDYSLLIARAAGTMNNPILYGVLLALVVPYAFDQRLTIARAVTLYLAMFAAGLSGSKTAAIAVVVFAWGAVAVYRWRAVRALPVVVCGLVLLFGSFSAVTRGGHGSRVTFLVERSSLTSAPASPPELGGPSGQPNQPSLTARYAALGVSLRRGALVEAMRQMTQEWGPLTWLVGEGYFSAASVGERVHAGYNTVDNVFLGVLYERGLLGLALFVGAFLTFLVRTRQAARVTVHWFAVIALGAAGIGFCWDAYSTFNILAVGSMALAMWHAERVTGKPETRLNIPLLPAPEGLLNLSRPAHIRPSIEGEVGEPLPEGWKESAATRTVAALDARGPRA